MNMSRGRTTALVAGALLMLVAGMLLLAPVFATQSSADRRYDPSNPQEYDCGGLFAPSHAGRLVDECIDGRRARGPISGGLAAIGAALVIGAIAMTGRSTTTSRLPPDLVDTPQQTGSSRGFEVGDLVVVEGVQGKVVEQINDRYWSVLLDGSGRPEPFSTTELRRR